MSNLHPVSITGKVTLSDGSATEFSIDPDITWNQWGNNPSKMGDTVNLMDALATAAGDHLRS
jgi:hypothetical protein